MVQKVSHGISLLPDCSPKTKTASQYYSDAIALCRQADALQLDYVKMTEHYTDQYGGYCPGPLTFLAWVAAQTRTIRLMTGGVLPTFAHPAKLAAEAVLVDVLSEGRLDMGFARGHLPQEFDLFGVPLDHGRGRFARSVETIAKFWTDDEVDIESEYFLSSGKLYLRPLQRPHPPIWVAAVQSRESFAWIGEQGYNLLVTPGFGGNQSISESIKIFRDCSGDRRGNVAISLPVLIRDTDNEAIADATTYLQCYLDTWADAVRRWSVERSSAYLSYTGVDKLLKADSPRAMINRSAAIVGSPATVKQKTELLISQLGVDCVLWQIDFGAMPLAQASQTLSGLGAIFRPHFTC